MAYKRGIKMRNFSIFYGNEDYLKSTTVATDFAATAFILQVEEINNVRL
jgi:hypothetical protein